MTINKGVRQQQMIRAKEMSDLRTQGLSWGEIAKKYKLDKNNVRTTVLNYRLKAGNDHQEKGH
jgi:Mor family transcriptional regulator